MGGSEILLVNIVGGPLFLNFVKDESGLIIWDGGSNKFTLVSSMLALCSGHNRTTFNKNCTPFNKNQ